MLLRPRASPLEKESIIKLAKSCLHGACTLVWHKIFNIADHIVVAPKVVMLGFENGCFITMGLYLWLLYYLATIVKVINLLGH